MKRMALGIGFVLIACLSSCRAEQIDFNKSKLNQKDLADISSAIYRIEGGSKTKFPYGIRSIKTSNPKQVCINTINNSFIRWNHNKKIDFLTFLANVYCPKSADSTGNKNWIKNIHQIVK